MTKLKAPDDPRYFTIIANEAKMAKDFCKVAGLRFDVDARYIARSEDLYGATDLHLLWVGPPIHGKKLLEIMDMLDILKSSNNIASNQYITNYSGPRSTLENLMSIDDATSHYRRIREAARKGDERRRKEKKEKEKILADASNYRAAQWAIWKKDDRN